MIFLAIYKQNKQSYQAASYFDSIILKNENGEQLRLSEGEKIIFGIKPHYSSDYIIKKTFTAADELNGQYPLKLTPEELDIVPERYYYDVSVQTADGEFIKIVPKSIFDVLESMTKKE